jgi:hypothetical protein
LIADGETETRQGNIQDWLQLDEGDPGFQLVTEEEFAAVIIVIFISITYIIKRSIYLFPKLFFLSLRVTFCFINPYYR